MDLDYQSQANVDINKQLHRADKLTSRLALTLKDIPSQDVIPQYLKDKIMSFITQDLTKKLIRIMEKQVVTWNRQIGAKGTRWNIIHLCAKFNANNSLKMVLKKLYQNDPDQYLNGVNSQTAQGFTPLMIAIIYKGDRVLELLMQLGGIDLNIIEKGKLRAYDLALHYRNQYAISQLIVYEDRCRKREYLNQEELQKPQPLLQQQPGVCQSLTSYLLDCFICFKYDNDGSQSIFEKVGPLFNKQGDNVDTVKVGSRKDIEDYEYQWRKLSEIEGQKIILFNGFNPQDICESQFCLKNNLILLQTLSDFSWLLRKVITKYQTEQGKPQRYCVSLYHNYCVNKLQVDECVPIIKQRGEPMFLSSRNQLWPMVLQKALAKVYGSYLSLNTLSPLEALETITGFYVKELPLNTLMGPQGLVSALQQLSLKGYMFLLQGRARTQLNSSPDEKSFAILNYYEKGNTRKLLISCPSIIQKWKEPKDIRQLAILKAHFSRHNQSCLWIDQSKLDYYFTHAVVTFLKEGYSRTDLKLKLKIKQEGEPSINSIVQPDAKEEKGEDEQQAKEYRKSLFFKFKLDRKRDEPIMLQITDVQTKHRYDLTNLEGWKDQGRDLLIKEAEHDCCPQIAKIQSHSGQYLCKFQLKAHKLSRKGSNIEPSKGIIKKKQIDHDESSECRKKVKLNLGPQHLQQIQLTTWAPEPLQLQLLEQEFGTIEWLAHFRVFVDRHWKQLTADGKQFVSETVNGKTIIVAKKITGKKICLMMGSCGERQVVEGKWRQALNGDNQLQLLSEGGQQCAYCVLTGVSMQTLRKAKLRAL